MRRVYITFSGRPYDSTTQKIVENAPFLGATDVWVYDDVWLMQQDFYKINSWLWDHPHKRGFGWYAWKPYILNHVMERLVEGDVVLYTDADTFPIADLMPIYKTALHDGAMFFAAQGWSNRLWCKRDCYIVMGQDNPKYHDCQHAVARFMAFRKGSWTAQQILSEWLTYCVNPLATTFDPSVLAPELEGFREHRTEQAILTLLAHKHSFKLHREACEAGEGYFEDRDLYPRLFSHANSIPVETR